MGMTKLGRAACRGPIRVDIARRLYNELRENMMKGIVLTTHFQLIIIVVPYDLDLGGVKVDWELFYTEVVVQHVHVIVYNTRSKE